MIDSLFHTFKADYKNRIRQQSYSLTLLCMAVLTLLFFPSVDAGYQTVLINDYRGIYNSAWMGASLAILNVCFLPLICFYLIKGNLESDRNTQVSELIGATSVSKSAYILGKWLSNVGLLLGMLIVMSLTVVFVQVFHGEDYAINVFDLILPQLIYVSPILALVASLAILFESIPILRGGLGNIVYFFLWSVSLVSIVFNVTGINGLQEQMLQGFVFIEKQAALGVQVGVTVSNTTLDTFYWQGLNYSALDYLPILLIFLIALVLLLAAIVCFDRFKLAPQDKSAVTQGRVSIYLKHLSSPLNVLFTRATAYFAFTRLIRLEFMLIIRGWPVWWYLLIIALVVAQLIISVDILRTVVLPISWLICVLALSPLGQRETQHKAQQLVFNAPTLMKQQFLAMIAAGTLLLLMVASGALLRFALLGDMFSIVILLSGALLIVLLALVCGILTKTSRTFEIVFTILWYIGPLNQVTYLDFIGVNVELSKAINAPLVFTLAASFLLVIAYMARRKQIAA